MKTLNKDDLKEIYGGAYSAAWITAIVRAVNGLLDLGRSLGSAVRRVQNGRICSL